jgi:ribosomal protein S18 acetylase RimI-like enzyme
MSVVRQATLLDAAAIARVEVETWRETYAGILSEKLLVGLSAEQRTRSWSAHLLRSPRGTLVATGPRGTVIGFGNCGAQRGGVTGFKGEIFTLYVQPEAQGNGLGRALLAGLFHRLVEQGMSSAIVWVLEQNPSRFFYERVGGTRIARRALQVGGSDVDALAYAWRDLPAILRAQAGTGRFPD